VAGPAKKVLALTCEKFELLTVIDVQIMVPVTELKIMTCDEVQLSGK
jgi:hypothetical protein